VELRPFALVLSWKERSLTLWDRWFRGKERSFEKKWAGSYGRRRDFSKRGPIC